MGKALSARDHVIKVLELEDTFIPEIVQAADVVLIAVPMQVAVEVAQEIAPNLREDALICDINSLKKEICTAMRDYSPGSEVLGTHPMFGPTVRSLAGQKIILCPVKPGQRASALRKDFTALGLQIVDADPETHDRMMAVIQVLPHFCTLVMAEAMRRSSIPIKETLRFTSPIYNLELSICGRLFAQDPDLYAEIEMQNPHSDDVRLAVIEAARQVSDVISTHDRDRFRALFSTLSGYFQDYSREAMDLSDHVIEALVSRTA